MEERGWWRRRDGARIKIEKMSTAYLIRVVKALKKKQEELLNLKGSQAEFSDEFIEIESKIEELTNEYFDRQEKYCDDAKAPLKKKLTVDDLLKSLETDHEPEPLYIKYRQIFKRR